MKSQKKSITIFAPATVANVAVGFDILGFAIDSIGDQVCVTIIDHKKVIIEKIEGSVAGIHELSLNPIENTATAPLLQLIDDFQLPFGFSVAIHKGIPLGSGLGGSASSAVAATLGACKLIEEYINSPFSNEQLIHYALIGEKVASGAKHGDNVIPCLMGGLQLIRSVDPIDFVSLPIPPSILTVVIHPHLRIDTRNARSILPTNFSLKSIIEQNANLGTFIAGIFKNDLSLIQKSMFDVLIEPYRSQLIPAFAEVKSRVIQAGALGFAISGSGPSVFAWVDSPEKALTILNIATDTFKDANLQVDSWISPISPFGAKSI